MALLLDNFNDTGLHEEESAIVVALLKKKLIRKCALLDQDLGQVVEQCLREVPGDQWLANDDAFVCLFAK